MNDRLKKAILWLIGNGHAATQEDLAELLGLNKSYLSQVVSGKKPVSAKLITHLCAVFPELNKDYLLTGSGEISAVNVIPEHCKNCEKNEGRIEVLKEIIAEQKKEIRELKYMLAGKVRTYAQDQF